MLAISSFGHAAGAEDLLAVVDVVEEGVERLHALLDALRQPAPFGAGDDARHDVEGDQPLGRLRLAVDGEGDAGLAEDALGVAHLFGQPGRVLRLQPAVVGRIWLVAVRNFPAASRRTLPSAYSPVPPFQLASRRKSKRNRATCAGGSLALPTVRQAAELSANALQQADAGETDRAIELRETMLRSSRMICVNPRRADRRCRDMSRETAMRRICSSHLLLQFAARCRRQLRRRGRDQGRAERRSSAAQGLSAPTTTRPPTAYAAPNVKRIFPTLDTFMGMVDQRLPAGAQAAAAMPSARSRRWARPRSSSRCCSSARTARTTRRSTR